MCYQPPPPQARHQLNHLAWYPRTQTRLGQSACHVPLANELRLSIRHGLMQAHTQLPLGHHTLGIECKGVLSTGVDRMLVGNRVGVGLTRSTINSFAPIQISHHESEKNCPHGNEPPVAGTGHPGFYPRWRILPTRPATSLKPSKSAVSGMRITT